MYNNRLFCLQQLFRPCSSSGSAFPGGDAKGLYSRRNNWPFNLICVPQSLRRLMALPESFRLFVGHDYPAPALR
ncbi:hypothetical protein C8F04DRAFT_1065058 [Mycena alexandri]|uniref:Uncharacterized protein n=1 Tax=Mycena alexandri TaxID=1745969 RepID=A0AAD6TF95_9AGAR|nr:hypothetical protein C8F04DRAFT_1065058 [Mycena alexandri]